MAGLRRRTFNGNFASLFAPGTLLQSVQSDLGITYGGTMLATGTTPPVITLTGALIGTPTAITITDTAPGILGTWTGLVTYGDNSTQTFTSAAIVPLTGKGAGLTLNIAAGAALGDNVWKATCAAWADQVGSATLTQATAAQQPVITAGLNGFAGIASDGVSQWMPYTLALPAPGTTPTFFWLVGRIITPNGAAVGVISSDTIGTGALVYTPIASANIQQFNGAIANTNTNVAGSWGRIEVLFSNSAADYTKFGTNVVTGGNAGNNAPTATRGMFGLSASNKMATELLAFVTANVKPNSAQLAALSAAVTAKYGATVQV